MCCSREQLSGVLRLRGLGSVVKASVDKTELAGLVWKAFERGGGGGGGGRTASLAGMRWSGAARVASAESGSRDAAAPSALIGALPHFASKLGRQGVSRATLSTEYEMVGPLDDSAHWVDSDEVSVDLEGGDASDDEATIPPACDAAPPCSFKTTPPLSDMPHGAGDETATSTRADSGAAPEWCAVDSADSEGTLVCTSDHDGQPSEPPAPSTEVHAGSAPGTSGSGEADTSHRRRVVGLEAATKQRKGRRRHIGWVYVPIVAECEAEGDKSSSAHAPRPPKAVKRKDGAPAAPLQQTTATGTSLGPDSSADFRPAKRRRRSSTVGHAKCAVAPVSKPWTVVADVVSISIPPSE